MNVRTKGLTYTHNLYKNPSSYPELAMLHSHNSYELLFFERGEATYVIENRKYKLRRGDLVFIRPQRYHYIELAPSCEYSRFNIGFESALVGKELIKSIPAELAVINCKHGGIISDLFSKMDYYSNLLCESDFADVMSSLLKELFYNLRLSLSEGLTLPTELSPFVTEALDYINSNLFTIKSVKEVAASLFVSEQYLFRQFQSQMKITPKKYLDTKRLLHAQKLLRRGKKPSDIYAECGFESYAGFYKCYLKAFGYSPSREKEIKVLSLP